MKTMTLTKKKKLMKTIKLSFQEHTLACHDPIGGTKSCEDGIHKRQNTLLTRHITAQLHYIEVSTMNQMKLLNIITL